jgi:hypothetical protein
VRAFADASQCHPGRSALPVLLGLLLALCLPEAAGSASVAEEYELKAAFLYQFTKYVSWPSTATGPVSICVLGDDPFGRTLDETLADKSAKGEPIVVRRLRSASDVGSCRILFVSRSEQARLESTLAALHGHATLTVSELSGFPSRGGMINLKVVDDRIKLEINPHNAERAGLKIRSELLRLADVVRD